ncbi:hypothetical protein QYG89_10575 [Bacillus sp. B190/17]|uniref:YtzI protein n=1 Tax=Bacillus lumedeiriae TaxID=3058829 RepID=A0ABW8I9G3_9BACI
MGLFTVIGLAFVLLFIASTLVYFLRQSLDSSDTTRIDNIPEYYNDLPDHDSTHDRNS